jgi:hypothetical protein
MPEFPQAFRDARFDDSLIACIKHTAATGIPLLALGQTVFWDELLKSMIAAAAQKHAPDLRLVAGAHDTDYFSKLPDSAHATETRISGFSLQPRDDHRTSQMWAAVAETSAVLGTEYPVTRAELRSAPACRCASLQREHPESPEPVLPGGDDGVGMAGSGESLRRSRRGLRHLGAQVSPTVRAN